MFPLEFSFNIYSNSRGSTTSCRSTTINDVFHTPPLARLDVRKVTPHAPPIIQTEQLLNAGMVSLSNGPMTFIGNVPQVSLIDDTVSICGDAANAVGGNLYDDSALPSANSDSFDFDSEDDLVDYSALSDHDADPEPRGMEDSSWFYIISITPHDSYV